MANLIFIAVAAAFFIGIYFESRLRNKVPKNLPVTVRYVRCPSCGAGPGESCFDVGGQRSNWCCKERFNACNIENQKRGFDV